MKKEALSDFFEIIGAISSLGVLVVVMILMIIQNTLSYEVAPLFEKTPKSSIFVIMEHNQILGYLLIILSVISAISTGVNVYIEYKHSDK